MKKKPILHICMEIKARELEGRVSLALEAASRGFRVLIGHKTGIINGLFAGILPSGVFFDKSLTRGKEDKLSRIKDRGCLLASQDEEGGILQPSYEHFISFRSTRETVDMCDAIFCWGEHDYESWARSYPDSTHKIHIAGIPRIDFWRSDYHNYHLKASERIRNNYEQFVLISSTFSRINNYNSIEEIILQMIRKGAIQTAEDEHAALDNFGRLKKLFKNFCKLITNLADKHPEINFVIRPHPAERMDAWKSCVPQKPNIHLLFEGGISPWVRAAAVVLHNGCTTGFEAYVSGTPAIAYSPFKPPFMREIPNRLSIECSTEEEVFRVLSRIVKGETMDEHRTPENDEIVRNRLVNVQGETAAKRIVDVLENLDVPQSPPISPGLAGKKMTLKTEYSRFINRFRNKETRISRKFPGLMLSELKEIQDNLAAVTDKYSGCRISRLFGDVFVVEKD